MKTLKLPYTRFSKETIKEYCQKSELKGVTSLKFIFDGLHKITFTVKLRKVH